MEFDRELPHEACQERERNLCLDNSGSVFSLTIFASLNSYIVHSTSLQHVAELHVGRSGLNAQLHGIAILSATSTGQLASWHPGVI